MDELKEKISKASKKMWAEMPPEMKKARLSKAGKSGGKNRWKNMSKEERKAHINKMITAKKLV